MTSSVETLGDLFARAPFEERGWDVALSALASATGSARGQLISLGERHLAFNWVTEPGTTEEFVRDFIEINGFSPRVNYRVAAIAPPMELAWEDHYDAIRRDHEDEAYIEYVRHHDAEAGAQMVLTNRSGAMIGLAVLKARSDGRSTEDQRALMAAVAPSVLAAVRTQEAIEHQGIALLKGSFEAVNGAAILLDGIGQVCAVTPAAEALLGPDTIQIAHGVLRSSIPEVDRSLQRQVGAALLGFDNGPAELWLRSHTSLLLVDVRPLPRLDWSMGTAPRVAVTLRAPPVPAREQARVIGAALGLTLAEAQVVLLLAQGQSRREVALNRGVSVQTVITQLRTVFQKCGVNREAELVALACAILEMGRR